MIRALSLLAAILAGCAPKNDVPEEAIQDMPPWMTKEGGLEVRLEVAKDLVESGNTIGALDVIQKMRADGIELPELDLLQGKALRLDGVDSEAERLLVEAMKKMPRDSRPATELCILYADDKRLDEAVEKCRKATQIDAKDARAWNNLGFLELAASHPAEAMDAASKAVELDSTEPRYRNNLGMAQAAVGKEEQAFHTLQSTMNRADAANLIGQVVERFRGAEAAAPWYAKATAIDPRSFPAPGASDSVVPPPPEGGSVPQPDSTGSEPVEAPVPAPKEAP